MSSYKTSHTVDLNPIVSMGSTVYSFQGLPIDGCLLQCANELKKPKIEDKYSKLKQ